jgi:serine/threonine protein kinase/tetratricopeptide (TPR) repeat protein
VPDCLSLLERFEMAWQAGSPPPLDELWPTALADRTPGAAAAHRSLLEELVKIDLEYRWRRPATGHGGDEERTLPRQGHAKLPFHPCLEDYVACYPQLGPLERLSEEVVAEEYRVRRRWGDRPSQAEYPRRFPLQADRLTALLVQVDAELAAQESAIETCDSLLVPPHAESASGGSTKQDPEVPDQRAEGTRPQPFPLVAGYEIQGELGRGGMGVVYKAWQPSLRRLVALKMILTGAYASSDQLGRFRREAEAAARLQHPNIVQIHEIGDQDGRPYFTLEFVEGGSLAKHLAGTPLSASSAADLVTTLARAVHYAHQHGIVHRDLKPANILLSFGREPPASAPGALAGGSRLNDAIPKITDFGLAKLLELEPGATAPAYRTESGAVLGTPSYMAPEQARGQGEAVGPAADIYALGAILYEAVTGRPPFKAASVLDTLEEVLSQEPVPPARLQPKVPRDLETICLKCLRKEPHRRYDSAETLADDLGRFRAGAPILARPVPGWERLAKWVRRRPAVAGLIGVSGLAILVLLLGILGHNDRLRREVVRAEAGEATARQQRRRADANYQQARSALDRMLHRLDDQHLAEVPRLRELGQNLREDALAFYQNVLADLNDPDPAVRLDTALASYQTAMIQLQLGQPGSARSNFERARALLEELSAQDPNNLDYRFHLAACHVAIGGGVSPSGDAEASLRKAAALWEGLCRARPDNPDWACNLAQSYHTLGAVYQNSGQRDRAEDCYTRALALREELLHRHPDNIAYGISQAESLCNLGLLHDQNGRRERAEAAYQQAASLFELQLAERAQNPEFLFALTAVYLNWGNLLKKTRGCDAALDLYTRAADLLEPVFSREPRHTGIRDQLLKSHAARAMAYYEMGRYADSVKDWDRVVELAEEPKRARYRYNRAVVLALASDHARANADIQAVADRPEFSAGELYAMAVACAVSCRTARKDAQLSEAERDHLTEDYGARAVALLRKAHAAGHFKERRKLLELFVDADLATLHSRPDFEQFLQELGKKK